MNTLRQIPTTAVLVAVTTVSTISWISLDGGAPVVIALIAGSLLAAKAIANNDTEVSPEDEN